MAKAVFLIKSEPTVYSFDDLVRDGKTSWDGVRNHEARNNIRAMKKGDLLLYYHSNKGKEIVGIARVATAPYKDPTAKHDDDDWTSIEVAPVKRLKIPVGLAQAKAHPVLSKMGLVKKSRISVTQVTSDELAAVLTLSKTKV
jgi:predicted RNA-binding protein with PUA-like domain